MTNPLQRQRYLRDTVATASPARLLVLLFDRLVLDLAQAESAQRDGRREIANERLCHAQDIVLELRMSLDVDAWDGAPGLAALYMFVLRELVQANVLLDPERTRTCRELVEPLRDAWREVAAQVGTPSMTGSVA
ncbi:MAG: flagellar export chaperone FliS [Pseudonocardiales bacterium]|nr:MAG: flagellar export chaperone FliS [Pseudonocardiales bacterium]